MTQESGMVSIPKSKIVVDESASLCGIKPVNFVVSCLIGSIFISIIWSFYSVAIEIIPMQEQFIYCPYNIEYNWNPGNNTMCKSFLEMQRNYNIAESTFWSLMVVAGLSPWVVISLIAVITTHDKVNKKYKEWWWCLLGLLLIIYFAVLLMSSFSGIGVYLYGSPAFIGVPLTIIIPSLVGFMKQINICKRVVCFVNIPVCIGYFMITTSLIILTSYIVWTPNSYYDLHYKAKILISCAYYYAFLASLILTYEIDYVYKFDNYPEIENYELQTITNVENNIEESIENVESKNVSVTDNMSIVPREKPVILAHILSATTVLVTSSWLSITKSYANISILALIAIFPFFAFALINLQKPFNQYLVSLRGN
jgi:hypothetical protein